MVEKGRIALIGGRTATGIASVAVAVGAIGASMLITFPSISEAPASVLVAPETAAQERVCPGPVLALGADASNANAASSVGTATIVSTSPGADVTQTPLASENTAGERDGSATVISSTSAPDAERLLAGSQSQAVVTETITGFAAATCQEVSDDTWLVGGSADLGRTTLILLSNPDDVDASVTLEVYGANGEIDVPASDGIIVPPNSQRFVSLAGLAPNEISPVVHVTSEGARIAATLQQTAIDGLQPGGVDFISPSVAPVEQQFVPGVVISGGGDGEVDEHTHGEEIPVARVLAPEVAATAITVTVTGSAGQPVATFETETAGGSVIDIPLTGVDAGTYSVAIDATKPVVASVRTSAAVGEQIDFAWASSTLPLGDTVAVAIAPGPAPSIAFANSASEPITVTLESSAGTQDVLVPASGAASIAVQPNTEYLLTGGAGVRAAVTYRGSTEAAAVPIMPPGPLDAPLEVYTH